MAWSAKNPGPGLLCEDHESIKWNNEKSLVGMDAPFGAVLCPPLKLHVDRDSFHAWRNTNIVTVRERDSDSRRSDQKQALVNRLNVLQRSKMRRNLRIMG